MPWYAKRPGNKTNTVRLKTPATYRQKTLRASRSCRCDIHEKEPLLPGYNAKDVWVHPRQKELVKKWKAAHERN
ncbi:MAG: hypothetical protein EOO10_21340 [Chitinophagaceae bacterium]|nr:MAG: hypothetical protein EOO10_21340 [Chitinophagaceae bacterium]